jgi:hypothetical protein
MNMSLLTKNNPDAKRRRALAKVYSLLLRLVEEAESRHTLANITQDEKTDKQIIESTNVSNQPVNSLTSQQDIPP